MIVTFTFPLPEEPGDVPLLRLVVVRRDLRSELDLLHVHLELVLARELRLLLQLVPVLAEIHDPADRGSAGGDLDESRFLERVLSAWPSAMPTTGIRIDQPHAGTRMDC
jgi:hypothetical protein